MNDKNFTTVSCKQTNDKKIFTNIWEVILIKYVTMAATAVYFLIKSNIKRTVYSTYRWKMKKIVVT